MHSSKNGTTGNNVKLGGGGGGGSGGNIGCLLFSYLLLAARVLGGILNLIIRCGCGCMLFCGCQ